MAWQSKKEKEAATYYVPAECRLDLKLCPEVIAFLDEEAADLASIQRTVWHLVNKKVFADKHTFNKYLQARFHIQDFISKKERQTLFFQIWRAGMPLYWS